MTSHRLLALTCIGLLLWLTGCQTTPPYAAAPPTDPERIERNRGYALLYATLDSEAGVDQVLLIKRPRREVADLLREIASFAAHSRDRLAALAEDDETLGYEEHGLPHAEARTRDLIERATGNRILLATGRTFEFEMLLTQHEALNYIRYLAEALRELEEDEDRNAFLTDLSQNTANLHRRVLDALRTTHAEE